MAGKAGHRTLAGRPQIQHFWQKDIPPIRVDDSGLAGGLYACSFCLKHDDPLGCCNFPATCHLLSTFTASWPALGGAGARRPAFPGARRCSLPTVWIDSGLVADGFYHCQTGTLVVRRALRAITAELFEVTVSAASIQLTKAMPPSIVCGSLRRGGRVVNGSRL